MDNDVATMQFNSMMPRVKPSVTDIGLEKFPDECGDSTGYTAPT